jgi:hypothetical protein
MIQKPNPEEDAMQSLRWVLALLAALATIWLAVGCGCDDDDDDNDDGGDNDDDAADDDAADDDAADDDDDTTGQCDGYDLTIEGVTETPQGDRAWVARLNIDIDTGAIDGVLEPDDPEIDPYAVTGTRFDEQSGEIEGSFPRPASMPDAVCDQTTIWIHADFTVIEDAFAGAIAYYCGSIDEANLLFTYEANGAVTCGDFAM